MFDEQLEQLLTNPFYQTDHTDHRDHGFAFDLSDSIAIHSFMMSVHYALEMYDEASVRHMLGWVISSARYPNLNYAISAYSGRIFQTALFAAELARHAALNDRSMNRHYAYIASSLVIAHANEQLENDTAVIETLLTCKTYLDREIGPETKAWVKSILMDLHPRWGAERLQDALINIRRAQTSYVL